MKSRITIEVDFENNNNPVLQVINTPSDDVRDSLVSVFIQRLCAGTISRWLRIEYKGERRPNPQEVGHVYHIIPITDTELPQEMALMQAATIK